MRVVFFLFYFTMGSPVGETKINRDSVVLAIKQWLGDQGTAACLPKGARKVLAGSPAFISVSVACIIRQIKEIKSCYKNLILLHRRMWKCTCTYFACFLLWLRKKKKPKVLLKTFISNYNEKVELLLV